MRLLWHFVSVCVLFSAILCNFLGPAIRAHSSRFLLCASKTGLEYVSVNAAFPTHARRAETFLNDLTGFEDFLRRLVLFSPRARKLQLRQFIAEESCVVVTYKFEEARKHTN